MAHAGFTAVAVDVVAEGDVELGDTEVWAPG
jgi:hypothetical protein